MFISKLNEFTGSFVSPIVDGVVHRGVETADDTGFAITLIPASSSGPHMAKAGEDRYYKRSGDSFYKMEHFDLEDMFGRRAQPKLVPVTKTEFSYSPKTVFFEIKNEGRGAAKHVCIEFPWKKGLESSVLNQWTYFPGSWDAKTQHQSLMFEPSSTRIIHPGMAIGFWELHLSNPPFQFGETTALECTIYCEGCSPTSHVIKGTLQAKGGK
jgi:hypothetical protein